MRGKTSFANRKAENRHRGRESNGQPGARNASGASGLFQTMPGWGSTATVEDQINAATRAYQGQGLSAWEM